jgi:hypothetical protein
MQAGDLSGVGGLTRDIIHDGLMQTTWTGSTHMAENVTLAMLVTEHQVLRRTNKCRQPPVVASHRPSDIWLGEK